MANERGDERESLLDSLNDLLHFLSHLNVAVAISPVQLSNSLTYLYTGLFVLL